MSLSDRLVRRNALLGRYAFPQLRPMAVAISTGIYLTVATLVVLLALAANYDHGRLAVSEFWRSLFVVFAILQFLLLWIVGMYHAGSTIRQEITEKSIDFFRLLPLSAAQKIAGVLVGRNIICLTLSAANTLLLAGCGLAAGFEWQRVLELTVFSWVGGAATMLMALLASTYERRGRTASGPAATFVLGIFLLPYAIAVSANWNELFPHGAYVHFFGGKLRLFVFLTGFAVYAGFWFSLGLVRRFRNERAALFTPVGAGLGLLSALVIAAGLDWTFLSAAPLVATLVFWTSTAVALLTVALGALRGWDDYLEVMERTGRRPGGSAANPSNLRTGAGLILLWGLFALLADARAGMCIPPRAVLTFMSFWFIFLFLMETSVAWAPLNRRIHLLTGFLALLVVILPLILAPVTGATEFMAFSPIGYLTRVAGDMARARSAPDLAPAAFNAALCALLAVPLARRFRSIPRTKRDARSHSAEDA